MSFFIRSAAIGCGLALLVAEAMAHGLEGVVRPVVLVAITVGLIAGAIVGPSAVRPYVGLGASVCVLMLLGFIAPFAYGEKASFLDFLASSVLVSFFGVVPLALAFLITFWLAARVRGQFGGLKRKHDL